MIHKRSIRRLIAESLESRICLSADSAVIPVQASAFGTTYGELGEQFWNWLAEEPSATHPAFGGPCEANQSGKVWFLPASFGGELNTTCTIPTGKAIFAPVLVSVAFSNDGPGDFPEQEDAIRLEANTLTDEVTSVNASLDGVDINAWNYRAESPEGGFTFTIPDDSVFTEPGFDALPGDYSPAVVDGYWLLLKPLSRGTHTISFGGEVVIGGELVFFAQTNVQLEIVEGQKPTDGETMAGASAAVLSDHTSAFIDAADHEAKRTDKTGTGVAQVERHASALKHEPTVEVFDLAQHEMPFGGSTPDDLVDAELLSLLAEDWEVEPVS